MLNKLCLASILAMSFTAAADAPARPPAPEPHPLRMPSDRCQPTGPALFEIDHRFDGDAKAVGADVSTLVLYKTGAWTFTSASRNASGCLDARSLATIRADIARADWKVEHAEITCMAISASSTDYLVNGKAVLTERLCGRDHLDTESTKALAEIEKIVTDASKPRTPPCCKK